MWPSAVSFPVILLLLGCAPFFEGKHSHAQDSAQTSDITKVSTVSVSQLKIKTLKSNGIRRVDEYQNDAQDSYGIKHELRLKQINYEIDPKRQLRTELTEKEGHENQVMELKNKFRTKMSENNHLSNEDNDTELEKNRPTRLFGENRLLKKLHDEGMGPEEHIPTKLSEHNQLLNEVQGTQKKEHKSQLQTNVAQKDQPLREARENPSMENKEHLLTKSLENDDLEEQKETQEKQPLDQLQTNTELSNQPQTKVHKSDKSELDHPMRVEIKENLETDFGDGVASLWTRMRPSEAPDPNESQQKSNGGRFSRFRKRVKLPEPLKKSKEAMGKGMNKIGSFAGRFRKQKQPSAEDAETPPKAYPKEDSPARHQNSRSPERPPSPGRSDSRSSRQNTPAATQNADHAAQKPSSPSTDPSPRSPASFIQPLSPNKPPPPTIPSSPRGHQSDPTASSPREPQSFNEPPSSRKPQSPPRSPSPNKRRFTVPITDNTPGPVEIPVTYIRTGKQGSKEGDRTPKSPIIHRPSFSHPGTPDVFLNANEMPKRFMRLFDRLARMSMEEWNKMGLQEIERSMHEFHHHATVSPRTKGQ